MSNLDLILAAMEPGKQYTTADLAKIIWPEDDTPKDRKNRQSRISTALRSASKYGIVEEIGTTRNRGKIWRLPRMTESCRICGEPAPYFTDTYDPEEGKPVCIYLCRKHQKEVLERIADTIMEAQG